MSAGRARPLALAVAALALCPAAACAQAPPPAAAPAADTEMVRGTPVTLSRVATTGTPLLVVRIGAPGRPPADLGLAEGAAALDRLVGKLDARHGLPPRVAVQLGGLTDKLMPLLQARLARPGANWDTRRGDVRRGSIRTALAEEALAVIGTTPIARVFTSRGYRLEPSGGTERVEVGHVPGFGAAVLPTYVGDLGLVAVRQAPPR